ncbi:hypothetical protein LMG33818_000894 [Halomonadaceae bacterium LMG 33818]|uniref:hypothetical protein n=1 Tax=Cernens ardua TaxID=3402176 RepID=UPI003EDC5ACE
MAEENQESQVNLEDPTIQAAIREAVDAEVNGLKSKRDELLGKNKQLAESLKSFEGFDPEEYKALKQQHQEANDKQLIDEGKIEELVSQRVERMKTGFEKQLQEANDKASQASAFADRFRGRVLSDELQKAGSELHLLPHALQDAIYRGNDIFTVDDEGNVIPKENAGLDAKGNALTPKAWLESMRETAPHWFPVPKGSGATGANGGKASLKRSTMSASDKREFIEKNGQSAYLKLPN